MFKAKYMLVGSCITNQILKMYLKIRLKIRLKISLKTLEKRTLGIKIREVNYGFT